MRVDDDRWLEVADAFGAAAVGSGTWLEGLSALASITGSRAGELIGLGEGHAVTFNWITDLGPEWHNDFLAMGGGDPHLNPHVRAGKDADVLQVRASGEFITSEERRSNPLLAEHSVLFDIPYSCLCPLIKTPQMEIGLAVVRSRSQGEIDARSRALFASLAPHVRMAVRTQLALENQGAKLLAGTLEALSFAVFVCDGQGYVRAMTPAAETWVGEANVLRLRGNILSTTIASQSRALTDAIAAAARPPHRPGAPASSTVLVGSGADRLMALEVVSLPCTGFAFGFQPRVLVIVRGLRTQAAEHTTSLLLRAGFGLTSAEADIALRLGQGQSAEMVAEVRKATIATVRAQIRSIYAKLEVNSLSGLISRLNQLR